MWDCVGCVVCVAPLPIVDTHACSCACISSLCVCVAFSRLVGLGPAGGADAATAGTGAGVGASLSAGGDTAADTVADTIAAAAAAAAADKEADTAADKDADTLLRHRVRPGAARLQRFAFGTEDVADAGDSAYVEEGAAPDGWDEDEDDDEEEVSAHAVARRWGAHNVWYVVRGVYGVRGVWFVAWCLWCVSCGVCGVWCPEVACVAAAKG